MKYRNRLKPTIKKLSGPVIIIYLVLLSCFSFSFISSCSTSECFDNKNSLPLAGFYSSARVPRAISLDSISILGVGAPGDSILQDSVRSLSQVYLPFRIDPEPNASTTYEIRYLGGEAGKRHISDLITFYYEIIPMFVSTACGVVYYYKMEDIAHTYNFIDSVTCPSGTITNANVENLKIYFRVDNGEDQTD